jgi:hypothetical protein
LASHGGCLAEAHCATADSFRSVRAASAALFSYDASISLARSHGRGDLLVLGVGVLKGAAVATQVTGAFDVKLTPQATDNKAEGAALGRMSIDKTYHGDLDATGKGEMLTAGSSVKDSGVYVAVEHVAGTLQGREGTFALHHRGVMTRGVPQLAISVVPDSGTAQLVGISGTMTINIVDGKHFYEFDYTISDAR